MVTINALTNFGENALTNYLVTGSGQKYLALFSTAVAEESCNNNFYGNRDYRLDDDGDNVYTLFDPDMEVKK